MPAWQETGREPLPRALPPEQTRPGRVCSQDESRVGMLTVRRRRLTARGVPPVGAGPQVFEGGSVDGAVAPTTGERFFRARPALNAASFPRGSDAGADACSASCNSRLLANSGAHPAQQLTRPANVRLVVFPPDGPELSPIERVWRDLQEALAWRPFLNVAAPQDEGGQLLRADEAPTRPSLTSYPYLVRAIQALLT